MIHVSCKEPDWIKTVVDALSNLGCVVVEDTISKDQVKILKEKLYVTREHICNDIGDDKLRAANEFGVLRIPMKYEECFLKLLDISYFHEIIDACLSPSAILHLQNGFILPSFNIDSTPSTFQNNFHRDFPRFLNGYRASINILCAIDEFTQVNGGTLVVPASHQLSKIPDTDYLQKQSVSIECPAGAVLVFDSTLWHASGKNYSGLDRLAINHQFTCSFIKQQIDYVRALGEETVTSQSDRVQQLLGFYTRIPTSLDEYYRPESERLYRRGQG